MRIRVSDCDSRDALLAVATLSVFVVMASAFKISVQLLLRAFVGARHGVCNFLSETHFRRWLHLPILAP